MNQVKSKNITLEFTGEGGVGRQRWTGENCAKTEGAQQSAAVARSGVMICQHLNH